MAFYGKARQLSGIAPLPPFPGSYWTLHDYIFRQTKQAGGLAPVFRIYMGGLELFSNNARKEQRPLPPAGRIVNSIYCLFICTLRIYRAVLPSFAASHSLFR